MMKEDILGTITDRRGRKNIVKRREQYAIIYAGTRNFSRINVDTTAFLNYDHDGYLGHDDCEGRSYGPRFLFDETEDREIWDAMPTERIIAVVPIDEYNKKITELFG